MATNPSSNWIQNLLGQFGSQYGFRTTSTIRSERENADANGVANSQHVSGTARDYSIKGKTPSQISDFLRALTNSGFEAFTHDAGSGEHVHAELPPQGTKAIKCPDWMPSNLCGAYSSIASAISTNNSATGAFADIIDIPGSEVIDDVVTRATLVILGVILIAIAVYFIFKPQVDQAALTAVKALI